MSLYLFWTRIALTNFMWISLALKHTDASMEKYAMADCMSTGTTRSRNFSNVDWRRNDVHQRISWYDERTCEQRNFWFWSIWGATICSRHTRNWKRKVLYLEATNKRILWIWSTVYRWLGNWFHLEKRKQNETFLIRKKSQHKVCVAAADYSVQYSDKHCSGTIDFSESWSVNT